MSTPGHSTRIAFGDADTFAESNSYTEFADVIEITPPTLEADDIERSNMTSPNQMKQFMPGWGDAGELEAVLEFEKAQATTVYGLFRKQRGYRLTFNDAPYPSGSKLMMDAYLKSIGNEVDREGLTTINVVFKLTGETDFIEAE